MRTAPCTSPPRPPARPRTGVRVEGVAVAGTSGHPAAEGRCRSPAGWRTSGRRGAAARSRRPHRPARPRSPPAPVRSWYASTTGCRSTSWVPSRTSSDNDARPPRPARRRRSDRQVVVGVRDAQRHLQDHQHEDGEGEVARSSRRSRHRREAEPHAPNGLDERGVAQLLAQRGHVHVEGLGWPYQWASQTFRGSRRGYGWRRDQRRAVRADRTPCG